MKLRLALLLVLALAGGGAFAAEPANPNLTALVRGVDDEQNRRETLRIERLDVAVRIHGGLADTIVTARFVNPGEENLEADFALALPVGSAVTGYALDVDQEMVEGVLVDQRKARKAYEGRLRQQVDPGLGEILRGFQFRTRVSPVPPRGSRTIRIRFSSPLDPRRGYVLPFSGPLPVGALEVTIEASGLSRRPDVQLPDGGQGRFGEGPGQYRLGYARGQARIGQPLIVSGIEREAPILVSRHPNGDAFLELSDSGRPRATGGRGSRTVAVLWDRSLSRADDALAAEAALLRAYLERVRPDRAEILFFDSGGVERVAVATPEAAAAAVSAARYRGGSSVAVLARQPVEAEACLLFSDGLVTIDRRDAFRPACPVFAIASAPDADLPWLGALAAASGGQALRLDAGNGGAVLERLAGDVPRVLSVRTTAGTAVDFTLLDAPDEGWRLVAPVPRSGGLVVRLAGPDGRGADRVYAMPSGDTPRVAAAGALWASERLALRAASDDADRDALVAFARSHRIGGPDISFIVLETPEDYARAGIEPPEGFPAEKLDAYRSLLAERLEEERKDQAERLETVLAAWDEQKAWWNERFDPNAKAGKLPDDDGNQRGNAPAMVPPPLPEPVPVPPPPEPVQEPAAGEEAAADAGEAGEGADLVVTGTRIPQPNLNSATPVTVLNNQDVRLQGTARTEDAINELPQSRATRPDSPSGQAEITLAEWSPERPYLAALRAARGADRERVLAEQQRAHGALPAFWLDVSEYYRREGLSEEALRLLLSALDLPTRNSETVAIVAARLARWGELDRAIQLYERLAAGEADRPQPLRSLALALAKRADAGAGDQARADLARAIALLTQVIMTDWADNWDGIELISLMEVNRLIPRYRALGGGEIGLDPRLVALLDVDLRIVVEWNTDETDLDLWVDEPNRERAIYSNPKTAIGGRLSNDMTNGYGPEEYLLRRAPDGTFTIRADTFAADQLNPNGASRITAHVFHDFGRRNEREEVIDVELLPKDEEEDTKLIGKVRVRR